MQALSYIYTTLRHGDVLMRNNIDLDTNSVNMVQSSIQNNNTLEILIDRLLLKGGRIDKYYLREWNRNKPAMVYLDGWFRGKNIREAITRALGGN